MLNIIVAGVGGQGTVLMSRLLGQAALEKNLDVRASETIGMAQRGGSVVTHVRMGQGPIFAPLIGRGGADLVIAFEPGEAVRALSFLSERGALVTLDRGVAPAAGATEVYQPSSMVSHLRSQVRRLIVADGEAAIAACGGAKTLNVVLLGVCMGAGLLPFDKEDALRVLAERIPERFLSANKRALEYGLSLADGAGLGRV